MSCLWPAWEEDYSFQIWRKCNERMNAVWKVRACVNLRHDFDILATQGCIVVGVCVTWFWQIHTGLLWSGLNKCFHVI